MSVSVWLTSVSFWPHIPLSHVHQNRVEPGLVNPGSARFYEFRSHAPVSTALCRLVTSVTTKMAYEDGLYVAILFTFLWLQQRRALQRKTHLSREAARRRHVTHFRLRQKQRRTFVLAATLSYFARATSAVRTIWVKPRNHTFFDEAVREWSNEEWKSNFRVSRETFRVLCTKLKPSLKRRMVVREPLSVEERVAITLWRLGTNMELRTLSHLFGVGISTTCIVVRDVCTAIVEQQDLSLFHLAMTSRQW